jgi:hypothetical protein
MSPFMASDSLKKHFAAKPVQKSEQTMDLTKLTDPRLRQTQELELKSKIDKFRNRIPNTVAKHENSYVYSEAMIPGEMSTET